jgi:ferredoxin
VRVRVDPDRCIGAGVCVLSAPEVFDQDPDEGVVLLLDEHPDAAQRPAVLTAAARCPAAVISVDNPRANVDNPE